MIGNKWVPSTSDETNPHLHKIPPTCKYALTPYTQHITFTNKTLDYGCTAYVQNVEYIFSLKCLFPPGLQQLSYVEFMYVVLSCINTQALIPRYPIPGTLWTAPWSRCPFPSSRRPTITSADSRGCSLRTARGRGLGRRTTALSPPPRARRQRSSAAAATGGGW